MRRLTKRRNRFIKQIVSGFKQEKSSAGRGKAAMIRIMVERYLKADKREELLPLLRELRTAAIHHPSYITGETLAEY